MACNNCDHTMQNTGENGGRQVYWCPRCGTLKTQGGVPEYETPTNSHLWPVRDIKAAPDLLAACEAVQQWADEQGLAIPVRCGLRAAIAKAETAPGTKIQDSI